MSNADQELARLEHAIKCLKTTAPHCPNCAITLEGYLEEYNGLRIAVERWKTNVGSTEIVAPHSQPRHRRKAG